MNPKIYQNNPLRRPQWRAERVWQLLEHCPAPLRPRAYDDHCVRAYYRLLVSLQAAGSSAQRRQRAIEQRAPFYRAHTLYFEPDHELRDILAAWLLTDEPLAKIANRFATDEQTVEYFEALFFNVRDRLSARAWIGKVIRGWPEVTSTNSRRDVAENQRRAWYRWVGFHGGALVLDATVAALAPGLMRQRTENAAAIFDEALLQFVRTRSAEAAALVDVRDINPLRLIKMAMRQRQSARSTVGSKSQTTEQSGEKVYRALERQCPDLFTNRPDTSDSPAAASVVSGG
jgi:hypothetical protein